MVILRRGPGELTRPLPDGFDELADHNLITFKSFREPLDDWAFKELTGHYVNYRKQVSRRGSLLPEDQFRLTAVCARHPRDLFAAVSPEAVQPGVYTYRRGSDAIRIIVAADLPKTERNALLHLFSAAADQVQYGAEHYRVQTRDLSTIINDLFQEYRQERLTMPYTIADYKRDVILEGIDKLTPQDRHEVLNKLLLKCPSAADILGHFTEAEIEAYLRSLHKKAPASRKKSSKSKD